MSRLPKPLRALAIRFDKSPIETVDGVTEFVRTRSAYVGQTALYGYLKTRMGTKFRQYFEDDVFSKSIREAAIKVFVSCLADLTIFAVSLAGKENALTPEESAALARRCFHDAINRTLPDEDREQIPVDLLTRFDGRIATTDWASAAIGESAFAGSARDLVRFAPVVDEFKTLDRDIVSNSIRFRWRDVRQQLRKRMNCDAVCADCRQLFD